MDIDLSSNSINFYSKDVYLGFNLKMRIYLSSSISDKNRVGTPFLWEILDLLLKVMHKTPFYAFLDFFPIGS